MSYLKKKFRDIKKFPTWLYWIPGSLMWLYYHCFFRVRVVDPNDHINRTRGAVTVTWHNRLAFFAVAFPGRCRRDTVAVVSASRDGQYVADFISIFGIGSVRGSSSKKGASALLGAVRAMREGRNVSFTPDGPRGPRYKMKSGPVVLASMAASPVVPISINAPRVWTLKSWDGFQIPKPFSTITLILGDAVSVPQQLDAEGIEFYRNRLETALMQITVDPKTVH